MPTAVQPFDVIQLGEESIKGTLLAATVQLPCDLDWDEQIEKYHADFPAGQLSNVGGAGVVTQRGTDISIDTDLTAEDIIWPLHLGIKGDISPTVLTTEYTYLFTPQLTTAVRTLDTATVELMRGDGATNHYAREVGHVLCRGFSINLAHGEQGRSHWDLFGRAVQATTPTAALTPYSGREPLVSGLSKIYLDSSWGNLGNTQLTGIIRAVDLDVVTGLEPDFTLDGRSELDMTGYKVGRFTAGLNLVMELDASGAAQIASYRANSIVWIRIKVEGSLVDANARYIQVDGAYRFLDQPSMTRDGDLWLLAVGLESVYDATGAKTLEFEVMNELSSL